MVKGKGYVKYKNCLIYRIIIGNRRSGRNVKRLLVGKKAENVVAGSAKNCMIRFFVVWRVGSFQMGTCDCPKTKRVGLTLNTLLNS